MNASFLRHQETTTSHYGSLSGINHGRYAREKKRIMEECGAKVHGAECEFVSSRATTTTVSSSFLTALSGLYNWERITTFFYSGLHLKKKKEFAIHPQGSRLLSCEMQ